MNSEHSADTDKPRTDDTAPVVAPDAPTHADKDAAEAPPASLPETLATIDARLKRIEDRVVPKRDKEGNKLILAGTFGFAGLILAGKILAPLGLGIDAFRAYRRNGLEAMKEMLFTFLTFGGGKGKEELGNIYKSTVSAGLIGAVVGPIVGVWFGYTRGDRLDTASDLITRPVESFHKIFGPAPTKTEEKPDGPALTTEADRAHHGTIHAHEKSLSA